MGVWKTSRRDAPLAAFTVCNFAFLLTLPWLWREMHAVFQFVTFCILTIVTGYSIIVVAHLFTHRELFNYPVVNGVFSVMNSVCIGQSVREYELHHVRNHHRYSNDRRGEDGTTKDTSSTYRKGSNGDHQAMGWYVLFGVCETLFNRLRVSLRIYRIWRVGPDDTMLVNLLSRSARTRRREMRQIQNERAMLVCHALYCISVSWWFFLVCYVPAWVLALALVNLQNYYRHFGANPDDRFLNSVSYYGRLYNALTFNDGYHQEHHVAPGAHWSELPGVRRAYLRRNEADRIVSPVPAVLGFLDTGRRQLHLQREEDAGG
jgi:fatty acid desaturase